MGWTKVVRASELPVGKVKPVVVDDSALVLCRVSEQEVRVVEDRCSHNDARLAGASLDDHVIECPHHGGRFDLRTGEAVRMPAASPIETVPAQITEDGWIAVDEEELP
ncbi:MAG: Rieske 2Fe-2S domain-containing protein [Deltaproteobacteria bacterium]|nr:Rieske 2Fe-2S domain-containing protein [Deltaproteobacteria bacterium]